MRDFDQMQENYRLTTAEIFYHLPGHPEQLQSYVWQEYDHAPDYPELHKFLDNWKRHVEGELHAVYIAKTKPLRPGAWRYAEVSLRLH